MNNKRIFLNENESRTSDHSSRGALKETFCLSTLWNSRLVFGRVTISHRVEELTSDTLTLFLAERSFLSPSFSVTCIVRIAHG